MSAWRTESLGKIAESVDYGITASASQQPIGPKFLRITDIQDGSVDWSTVPWCTCSSRAASQARLRSGDIVFARTGATTGKSFLIRDCPADVVFASYLIRMRLGDHADPSFVSHYFATTRYWAQIAKNARGVAQVGVNATTLKSLEIPLPPLREQRRIAAILDKADALRAKRRAALAQLDTLSQSIFLEMFGDPETNVKGWPTVPLGAHTRKIGSGATPRGGEEAYKREGTALVRSMNVRDGRFLFQNLAFIDRQQASKLDGVTVETNDILLNITGASVARVCRAPLEVLPARVNQHVCILRPSHGLNAAFLEHFLLKIKRRLLKMARAGATREAITKNQLERLLVIQPPTLLQTRFAQRVEKIEKLKGAHFEATVASGTLFASLQHRAFLGEL